MMRIALESTDPILSINPTTNVQVFAKLHLQGKHSGSAFALDQTNLIHVCGIKATISKQTKDILVFYYSNY